MLMSADSEELYERAGAIMSSAYSPFCAALGLDSLFDSLGEDSDMLDDVFYEHLGMSCKEVVEVLIDEDIRKSCQKHVPFY